MPSNIMSRGTKIIYCRAIQYQIMTLAARIAWLSCHAVALANAQGDRQACPSYEDKWHPKSHAMKSKVKNMAKCPRRRHSRGRRTCRVAATSSGNHYWLRPPKEAFEDFVMTTTKNSKKHPPKSKNRNRYWHISWHYGTWLQFGGKVCYQAL